MKLATLGTQDTGQRLKKKKKKKDEQYVPQQKTGWTQMLAKSKLFLTSYKTPACYSFTQSGKSIGSDRGNKKST